MRGRRFIWVLALWLAACPAKNEPVAAGATPPPAEPVEPATPAAPSTPEDTAPTTEDRVIETIEETTVGDLGGIAVPMGNMLLSDTYTLPDGAQKTGITCNLAIPGGSQWVGVGSVVQVGDAKWEVVGIEKERGELGSVTLAKL